MQNQAPPPYSSNETPAFYRNPGLAAVLSFFYMGLGQIYNGQIGKGVAFIVMYTFSWILMILLIGIITTPILWIYGMYDAYKSAEKINFDIARQATYSQRPPNSGPYVQ
jgi:TM2 domain-containing membrane protein YozV